MTSRQFAKKLHQLWGKVQDLHMEAADLLDREGSKDPCSRLALELALHDLLAFSARAATLATFVEAVTPKRKIRT